MTGEVMRYINRLFERHARRMRNIVSRGVVSLVSDGLKMQENQIRLLDGEIIDGAERAQQYGFTSHPQNGAECFVVFAGAAREHPIILSVDDRRYRFKSHQPGEVRIYTDEGDYILLKRDNTIEIKTKHLIVNAEEDVEINTKKYTLNAENVEINASDHYEVNAGDIDLNAPEIDLNAPIRIGLNTPALVTAPEYSTGTATLHWNIEHIGNYDQIGDYTQEGSQTSTGDQTAGGVSQMHHVHTEVAEGDDVSGEPEKGDD
jgi:phage baseplate assembly protein V